MKSQDEMWVEVQRWFNPVACDNDNDCFEECYANWLENLPSPTLDALHEAEAKLTQSQIDRYTIKLGIVIGDEKLNRYNASWDRIHATKKQRLLALWRTIARGRE
jgi:hypothetical protein